MKAGNEKSKMLSLMKVTLISKINWLQVAHVYFYGVPFSTEREWEKKKKSEKRGKGCHPQLLSQIKYWYHGKQ